MVLGVHLADGVGDVPFCNMVNMVLLVYNVIV